MSELRYSPDHLWWSPDGTVGPTRRLIASVAPLTGVELPEPGAELRVAERFGALHGSKLLDPASLERAPDWLIRVDGEPGRLLTEREYGQRTS